MTGILSPLALVGDTHPVGNRQLPIQNHNAAMIETEIMSSPFPPGFLKERLSIAFWSVLPEAILPTTPITNEEKKEEEDLQPSPMMLAILNSIPSCGGFGPSFGVCGPSCVLGDAWCGACGGKEQETASSFSLDSTILAEDVDLVRSPTIPCDPQYCRMSDGICVDCTKCLRHCECGGGNFRKQKKSSKRKQPRQGLNHQTEAPPPLIDPNDGGPCNPRECKQVICTDCMRCTAHCICDYGQIRHPPHRSSSLVSMRDYDAEQTRAVRGYSAERSSSVREYHSERSSSYRDYPAERSSSYRDYPAERSSSYRDYPAERSSSLRSGAYPYSRNAGNPPPPNSLPMRRRRSPAAQRGASGLVPAQAYGGGGRRRQRGRVISPRRQTYY
jgi:hypothetical protein